MEIIDFEIDANGLHDGVTFIFGEQNGTQWGDDWNDAPYEHNRGPVYSTYVVAKIHCKLGDYIVLEPADTPDNDSKFSMENLMEREAPCTLFVPRFLVDTDTIPYYKDYVEKAQVYSVYLGDTYDDLSKILDKIHSRYNMCLKKITPHELYTVKNKITVARLRKILQLLEDDGCGDYEVAFGYDDNFAYTSTNGDYDIVSDCGRNGVYFRSVL